MGVRSDASNDNAADDVAAGRGACALAIEVARLRGSDLGGAGRFELDAGRDILLATIVVVARSQSLQFDQPAPFDRSCQVAELSSGFVAWGVLADPGPDRKGVHQGGTLANFRTHRFLKPLQ